MNRLHASRLIWGNLLTVDGPHLIERYARAMRAFGLDMPALDAFEIDMTGWSREVADALGDPAYLDPGGVNRRFVVLSPAQARLPVVHSAFSNTGQLMAQFFRENARIINALTIKDVIYGEIEDSIAAVETMEDLLAIEEVRFRVMSADDTVRKATELRALADRLEGEPDAWRDDAMLHRMVELARSTGDIRRTALVPDRLVFRHEAFWASHFGGVYVFHDGDDGTAARGPWGARSAGGTGTRGAAGAGARARTTVIGDPAAPGFRRSRPWQVAYLDIRDAASVFDFLARTGRLEMPRDSWVEPSGYLAHRAAMALRAAVARHAPDLDPADMGEGDMRRFMARHGREVEGEGTYPFLVEARRRIARTGRLDPMEVEPASRRFALVRARPDHTDRWLTSRLIAEFVPDDFVSAFVFHKPLFYRRYEGYDERRRAAVVSTLELGYVADKRGFRRRLYGFA